MSKKGRVFSGARPTGRQHLGNYLGAIQNYVALQQDYDCIYCIVDVHALTTVETTQDLKQNTFEMTVDWLAAGIRPEESILFVQSHVPEVMELHTYLSMVTQIGKLTDLPTFKEKVAQQPENVNYGLLGYPVLMTADIVLYKADIVPVGIDQAPHLEFAREIVRSFNYRYNTKVLIEPQVKHTEILKVLGIDGKAKMSKSLNNHIELASTPEETTARVREMVTDPARMKRTDPGNPDVCNVYSMHKIFSSGGRSGNGEHRVPPGGHRLCGLQEAAGEESEPASRTVPRSNVLELAAHPDDVQDVLSDGGKSARLIAQKTMEEVREAIQLP